MGYGLRRVSDDRPCRERVAIKVLVVDDNLVVLRQLSMLLEQLGCEVSKAANGFEAMKIVKPEQAEGNGNGNGKGNVNGDGNGNGNGNEEKDPLGQKPPPRPFDIILIDLLMPGMSGMELAHRLRALSSSGTPSAGAYLINSNTYMCAITATAGNLSLCYDMGFNSLLVKPVQRSQLQTIIMTARGGVVRKRTKVLVADRNVSRAKALSSIFEEMQCDVTMAGNTSRPLIHHTTHAHTHTHTHTHHVL